MSGKKPKLFLGLGRLMSRMESGNVTVNDLEGALFYFRCTRAALDYPVENSDVKFHFNLRDPEDYQRAEEAYDAVKKAVDEALADGRADFRETRGKNTFSQLNHLLASNGIDTKSVRHFEGQPYSRKRVEDNYGHLVEML